MKFHKTRAVVLFLCLCVTLAGAQTKKLRVVADSADIYIEPHRNSTVIGTVRKGMVLTLFDSGGGETSWFYVSFYSEEKWATITGFVEASLVAAVDAPEKPGVKEDARPEAAKAPRQQAAPPAKAAPPEKTVTNIEAEAQAPPDAVEAATEDVIGETSGLVRGTGEVKVTGEKPAIRAAPDEAGRILLVARFGEILELNGKIGSWYRVKYPRPDGIVLVGFVDQAQVEVLSSTLPGGEAEAGEPEPVPEKAVAAVEAASEPLETMTKAPPAVTERGEVPEAEPSAAQETRVLAVRPLSLLLNAGYALPSETVYEGGFVFGADIAYLVNRNLAVVLGFYRYQSKIEGTPDGLTTGKLTSLPVSLGLQGRYPVGERLVPYAAAGVAYHFNSYKLCQMCRDQWDALGFDVNEEVESALGFQLGAGLDFSITDYIDLNLDARYQFLKASGSWTMADQFGGPSLSGNLEDLNFNALILRVGAKIFLDIL